MQIRPHHPEDLEQLRQRSRQQRDAKQRDRYRAVVLALEGHGAPEIAETLARSRRFVQLWVYAYRDHGPDAIAPKRQSGCPASCPWPNNNPSRSVSWPVPPRPTASARCGPKTSGESSRRNSGSSIAWRECMICSIVWAFPAWPHAPGTARTIRPPCSSGSNKPPFCPGHGPATSRPASPGLVPR